MSKLYTRRPYIRHQQPDSLSRLNLGWSGSYRYTGLVVALGCIALAGGIAGALVETWAHYNIALAGR